MTLTIDLTPDQQAALEAEATAHGMALPEFARLRLLESASGSVPQTRERVRGNGEPKRRPRIMGKYAGLLTDSETFAREKQEEIAREEARR